MHEDCGRNSLIIPNESCINCIYLEAPLSYSGYQKVTIHDSYKQQQIVNYMENLGVQKAVIGLQRIGYSELFWVDGYKLNFSARQKQTITSGARTCFYMDTSYPANANWVEVLCEKLNVKYYLLEWTNVFEEKKLPEPIWYDTRKPYLFQCKNNESISFAFECDQKADCSDLTDEKDCEYSNAECLLSQTGSEFYGIHRTMDLGFVCMTWRYHSPHEHRYNFLEDNENFCRYADSEPKPWCYTINSDVRWGHCTIPMCNRYYNMCLHTENGIEYTGIINKTRSGLTCRRWNSDIPHNSGYHALDNEASYCRYTPDKQKPWCFTTDQSVPWEYCDLPQCGTGQCPDGYIECLSGVCIPAEKACDGKADCPNNEDEINCAIDARYRNKYIWHDQEWRSSSFCAIAGFIATVSSESSAILVCLIAVDRCLAIRLPYSRFKVTLKYAIMLSIGSFLIAVILAAVPLLPLSYFDGKFYSRSTVCIALPLTSDRPPGWHYSVAVFVGFNMVLFFTVGISQTIIYRDVRKTMSSARNKQLSVEIKVARSLAAVVLTDFFCWFPVGVMGILGLFGVEIPSDIYAWVIVFILPVNSAINPFLYTFSQKFKNSSTNRGLKTRTRSISGEDGILARTNDLTGIALDFHNRWSKKSCNVGICLNNYLQTYSLDVKNLYKICFYTITELNYLHFNQMVHGNISKDDICLVERGGTVTDVIFQFKQRKTHGNAFLDIEDYGKLVKNLIKHHSTQYRETTL